jgi:hypothetical protein
LLTPRFIDAAFFYYLHSKHQDGDPHSQSYQMVGHASESRNLLDDEDNTIQNDAESAYKGNRQYLPPALVLPLALLSALAMSSTSATAYFTYGTIICKDQTRCSGREVNRFVRYVAIATAVSNVLGLIALGPLQRITKTKLKRGLTFWITVRSFSPIMLFFGSQYNHASCRTITNDAKKTYKTFTLR